MGIITLNNMCNKQTGFVEKYKGGRETDQQIMFNKTNIQQRKHIPIHSKTKIKLKKN